MKSAPLQHISDNTRKPKSKLMKSKEKIDDIYRTTDGEIFDIWNDAVEHQVSLDEKEKM